MDTCVRDERNRRIERECSSLASSNSGGDCRSLLNSYDQSAQKSIEECSRLNVGSLAECQSRASQCASGGANAFADPAGGSALGNLFGSIMQMQMAGSQTSANGCLIQDDDKASQERQRLDEKIADLRNDIAEEREKAAEADRDLNEKRREVEEKMADLEEDANKAKVDRQTKNQEQAADLQKQILDSEKKRRQNSLEISKKTIEMANKAFDLQQVNLEFAQARVTAACDQRVETMKDQKLYTTDARTGTKKKKSLTASQTRQIQAQLEAEQQSCYDEVALGQRRKTSDIQNQKRELQMAIDELNASNADEVTAVNNARQNMEALKTISTDEEAKEMELKLKKLDSLNKSVTDMEQFVQNKKKTIDEKIAAKNDQINLLIQERNNVQARFSRVFSTVASGSISARNFLGQCCAGGRGSAVTADVAGFADACRRIRVDYDRTSTTGGSMIRSGTGI